MTIIIGQDIKDKNLHYESKDPLHVASPILHDEMFSSYNLTVSEQKDHYSVELDSNKFIILLAKHEIRTKFFLFCFSKMILATLQEQNFSSYVSVNYQVIIL